jgi:hypothetical protein
MLLENRYSSNELRDAKRRGAMGPRRWRPCQDDSESDRALEGRFAPFSSQAESVLKIPETQCRGATAGRTLSRSTTPSPSFTA